MGEGEVPHLSVELPLPLAVDAHLGHLDDVTNLQGDDWNIFRATSDNQLSLKCTPLSQVGLELIYSLQIILITLLLTSSLRAVLS